MGCFSFLDCANEEHTLAGDTVCILVPKEKRESVREFLYPELDENIWENSYGLYGDFDGVDVYEYLAFVNLFELSSAEKEELISKFPKIKNSDFGGLSRHDLLGMRESGDYTEEEIAAADEKEREKNYLRALLAQNNLKEAIRNYNPGDEDAREIGIELFFEIGNKNLKYPLKITHCNDVSYEDVTSWSEDDPGQGLWY